ncbi:MAG TPA: hypothetical protein VJ576_07520 [Rhodocyclaceae bacterium]|nr:hypothetical protein [Rhodocyclaceae bacterium]
MHKLLTAAGLACWFSGVQAVTGLPTLDDPQLQEFLNILNTEYDQYLANPAEYFAKPATPSKWPCEVNPKFLNLIADTTNSDDIPEMKKFYLNEARSTGADPVSLVFSNQTFYPIKASCKNGKLDGPVEFAVEYDMSIATAKMDMRSHRLKRVRAVLKENAPVGPIISAISTLSSNTIYSDPATAEMMAKQKKSDIVSAGFVAHVPSIPIKSHSNRVALSHVVVNGKLTRTAQTTRVADDGRVEENNYGTFGSTDHRDFTNRYKDGKRHGEFVRYPGTSGSYPIPASKECWENGEKVLTTSCNVQ